MKTLVIVESPAKAKKIQSYLGANYIVKSSFGHLTNLKSKNLGVDIANDYKLVFDIVKRKQLNELKECVKKCSKVIIASDEDREGEGIAWHLINLLKLDMNEKNRIVFHEITKSAIEKAIENPRKIDINLVNAQKARQGLDYLVGFQVSPYLWRSIDNGLSAGRVQSIALKLIVDKENDFNSFENNKEFGVIGNFNHGIIGRCNTKFKEKDDVEGFLQDCISAQFMIDNIIKKKITKNPPPPFITSTIQIEAGKKFGASAKSIMNCLQKLYEDGKITYHRTDSVLLSRDIKNDIKNYVHSNFGENYVQLRNFKNKTKNAQEAHEAIRPTNINLTSLHSSSLDNKIYELIWKRTMASQMASCILNVMEIYIQMSNREDTFTAKVEKQIFDGYRKIYQEMKKKEDEDEAVNSVLSGDVKKGDILQYESMEAKERFKNPPTRYTEATLVKKMETLEIGRPSTYASIMTTVQERNYVKKTNIKGEKMDIIKLVLIQDKIKEINDNQTIGACKNALVPTNTGIMTCEYLNQHFSNIMDYSFTSNIEKKLDEISQNQNNYYTILDNFYTTLKVHLDECSEKSVLLKKQRNDSKKLLGEYNGKNVYIYEGRYGPCLQLGDKNVVFIGVDSLDITYEEAILKCQYPKTLGKLNKKDILLKKGKFGFYLEHNKQNYKLKEDYNEHLTLENAIDCIENSKNKLIKKIGKYSIKSGEYGLYIQQGKTCRGIPKDMNVEDLNVEKIEEIMNTKKKKFFKKK